MSISHNDDKMPDPSDELVQQLTQHNQQHVLRWWGELQRDEQQQLTTQLLSVDFDTIASIRKAAQTTSSDSNRPARAAIASAPAMVVRQPTCDADKAIRQAASEIGEQLLCAGKVAVITVAGGQGSRLGFDHPKGMFPVGPVSERTLFQIFAEQIQARKRRHGGEIPWLIMTSSATHDETTAFFDEQGFFGLAQETVHFFEQGSMPAVDAATGRLLMKDRASLCLSPDGHGGLVTALKSSGLLDQMAAIGVEHFFYHQVDNPTVILCDPVLIGLHQQHDSQLTTNVVRKSSPAERMGVLVDVDKKLEIIEYSELTEQQAAKTDESGQWIFWAGNTAIHVFTLPFFQQLASGGCQLELHLASKKVSHLNDEGEWIEPPEPNANKFERFIFDALPLAQNSLIVEGDRDREFNPVKNAEGADSPATAKAALNRIAREWMRAAGQVVSDDSDLEISPLEALDAEELLQRLQMPADTAEPTRPKHRPINQ